MTLEVLMTTTPRRLCRTVAALLLIALAMSVVRTAAAQARYELIGEYDKARLDKVLGDELQEFLSSSPVREEYGKDTFPPARYAVKLYRVRYESVVPELGNRPTVASGLVAVPQMDAADPLPVVSYQHGTVFDKDDVPSRPDRSSETRIMIARFAAQGYVVIAADYFGRGDSDLPDSYLVKGSTQQAAFDMLGAARQVLTGLGVTPGRLFISGWSQGGWATLAFLEKLESLKVPVAAAAVASGPVDIALTLDRWLNNPQPGDAFYLPGAVTLQVHAFAYYRQTPGMPAIAIQPDYVAAAGDLYAGRMDFKTFYARTRPTLAEFTTPAFRALVASGQGAYWQALDASQVYRWRLVTPLRTWYGGSDEVTPVWIGKLPQQVQTLLGGAETKAVDAGAKADHRGVFLRAVLDQKPWFDGLPPK
jgi:acetyl esterase/lipase